MASIYSYPYDIVIQDNDAWIGTDSLTRKTKQYTAAAVANYLNINGKVSIGGQMVYSFSTIPLNGAGTFALPSGGGSGTGFSAVTSLKISITEKSGQNVVPYVSYLVDDEILVSSQEELSQFGHYKITSYTVDPVNSSFYTLNLEYIGGNGTLVADKVYDIVNFNKKNNAAVEFVTGGEGINMTGTVEQPVVNIDYYGPDNFIEIAPEITFVDSGIYSPELLVSKSNPGEPVSDIKKVKISNISLDKLGSAVTSVSFGNNRILNLALPVNQTDAASKQYVDNQTGGLVQGIGSGSGIKIYGSPATPYVQVEYLGINNFVRKATTITSIVDSEDPYIAVERAAVSTTFGNGTVSKIKLNQVSLDKLGAPVASLSVGNQKITNLSSPTTNTDAVNKLYVDTAVSTAPYVSSISENTGITVSPNPTTSTGTIGLNYFTYISSTPNGSSTAASTDEIAFSRPGVPPRVYKTSLSSIPVDALASVKTYIDNAVVGTLQYQGGYDASVAPPTGTSIKQGFAYAVTNAGNGAGFFSVELKPGDMIIAQQDNPTTEANWTEIQSNVDVASAGTESTATRGLAGFNEEDFTVSSTGLVSGKDATLSAPGLARVTATDGVEVDTVVNGNFIISLNTSTGSNPLSKKVSLNSIDTNITRAFANDKTTFVVTITSGLFASNVAPSDLIIQVHETTSGDLVYVETQKGTSDLTIIFNDNIADGDYQLLITRAN